MGKKGTREQTNKAAKKNKQISQLEDELIDRYKVALNRAVSISTTHNITPITGTTIIIIDLSSQENLDKDCSSGKTFGSQKTVGSISSLLSLMCASGCERAELMVVCQDGCLNKFTPQNDFILDNVQPLLDMRLKSGQRTIQEFFEELIIADQQINNVVFFDNVQDDVTFDKLTTQVVKYKHLTNTLNSYCIRLNCTKTGRRIGGSLANYWVPITGCSDQILSFIAQNGDLAQLTFVDNIDKFYNLKTNPYLLKLQSMRKEESMVDDVIPLSITKSPKWSTCRVFISSTFLDMFSERDLLVRHVFDELRRRGRSQMINVVEVDLRWGITEEESKRNDTLELCLTEVMKSEFFIGMLGERYGKEWEDYADVSKLEGMEWLSTHPTGSSLTELEFQQCFQSLDYKRKAFFYFRDPAFIEEVTYLKERDLLVDEGGKKLKALRTQVKASGAEVFDGYPCKWGGVNEDGQPIVHGLEQFGERVLNNLWNAIVLSRSEHLESIENNDEDEMKDAQGLTLSWVQCLKARFKGRKKLLTMCVLNINQHKTGLMLVTGRPGSGKSSMMAKLITQWTEEYRSPEFKVVVYCVGAFSGSNDIISLLTYLCVELKNDTSYVPPKEYKCLCLELMELLNNQDKSKRLLLFLDGLDQLDDTHDSKSITWLPESIPANVLVVMSLSSYSEAYASLKKRKSVVATTEIGDMEIADRMEMARGMFGSHAKKLEETAFNNQMRTLVQKREASSPMYLTLACEEVRKYGNYDQLSKKLSQLPATLDRLMTTVLERAEEEYGDVFVKVLLCCLYCCRDGLTEDELCQLDFIITLISPLLIEEVNTLSTIIVSISMPPSASSSLLLSSNKVLSFLQSIRPLLKPFSFIGHKADHAIMLENKTFRDIIFNRYLSNSHNGRKWFKAIHLLLAYYFYSEADPTSDLEWNVLNHKALSNVVYHVLQGQDIEAWQWMVLNWKYVKARFMVGQGHELMQEYALQNVDLHSMSGTSKKIIDKVIQTKLFKDYQDFVMKNCHILSRYPQLLMQQALMQEEDSSVREGVEFDSYNLTNPYFHWYNCKDFKDHCLHSLDNFKQVVTCMCLNKNNSLLAVGFDDAIIRLFNPVTYQMTRMLIGHGSEVTSLCFVGEIRLCSASKDRTLSLWNVPDGYRISVLEGHDRVVSGCVSDEVGRVLVSVGLDGRVLLWHGGTGKMETTLARERSPINCVAMDPEGRFIMVGLWQGSLHMYDLLERRRSAVFTGHAYSVKCVAFDQSGDFFTSADVDGEVRTWSVKHGCTVSQFKGHSLPINSLSFSQHNLLTASNDSLIKVSSGKAGKCVGVAKNVEDEKEDVEHDETRATCLSINPNSSPLSFNVVTGYHQGCVRMHSFLPSQDEVWMKQLSTNPVAVSCISFLQGEKAGVMVGRVDGSIFLLDSTTGNIGHRFEGLTAKVTCIAITSTTAICACEDKFIYLFDVSSLEPLSKHRTYTVSHKLSGHDAVVSGVCVSPSQQLFVSVGYDMKLIIWSLEDHAEKVHVIEHAHSDWITCCAWSNHSDYMVTGSLDFTVKLWCVSEGVEKKKMVGHMASVSSVAYEHGVIVSSCTNGEFKVWSHKGVLITSIQAHKQRCNDLALSFDFKKDETELELNMIEKEGGGGEGGERGGGRGGGGGGEGGGEEEEGGGGDEIKTNEKKKMKGLYVVTCSDDSTTKLWRPLETEERSSLIGHVGGVTSLVVGREGLVCSGGQDGSVKVWRVAEGVHADDTFEATVVTAYNTDIVCVGCKKGMLVFWKKPRPLVDQILSFKFKISDEDITAASFLSFSEILVATVDKQVMKFEVANNHHSFNLHLISSVKTAEVITSLQSSVKDEGLLWMGTHLSKNISLISVHSGPLSVTQEQISKKKTSLVNPICYTTSFTYNHLPTYSVVAGSPPSCAILFCKDEYTNRASFVSVRLKCDVWMSSVTGNGKDVILGDCLGKVWLYSQKKTRKLVFGDDDDEYSDDGESDDDKTDDDKTDDDKTDDDKDVCLELEPRLVFKAHEKGVLCMSMIGELLVTASQDLLIKVWSLHDNKQLGQFTCPSSVVGMHQLTYEKDYRNEHPAETPTLVCASNTGSTFIIEWRS